MKNEAIIREIKSKKDKGEICEKVLRSLPDWFGIEQAVLDYIRDVQEMPMLAAYCNENLAGFTSLNLHNESTGPRF